MNSGGFPYLPLCFGCRFTGGGRDRRRSPSRLLLPKTVWGSLYGALSPRRLRPIGRDSATIRVDALTPGLVMQLDEIPRSALSRLLESERQAGTLWRRRFQDDALASAAAQPEVLGTLAAATLAGDLDQAWLERLLAIHPSQVLFVLAGRRLELIARSGEWSDPERRLLERVADVPAPPVALAEAALDALAALARPSSRADAPLVVVLIRLARFLDRPRVLDAINPHWSVLCEIANPVLQNHLVRTCLDPGGGSLLPADLLDHRGRPRLTWLLSDRWARRLLQSPALVGALAPECLLTLAASCDDPELVPAVVYPALDDWLRRDTARTLDALIQGGAWRPWRLRARPSAAARHALALRWLMAPAHSCRGSLPDGMPVEWSAAADAPAHGQGALANMETWDLVMADLVEPLTGEVMGRITAPATHWPPIHPFERRQALDLAARAGDLGALAVLADSLARPQGLAFELDMETLIGALPGGGSIGAADLCWLCRSETLVRARSASPGLRASRLLCEQAGVRIAQALEARVAAVFRALESDPAGAIAAAASPPLWGDRGFRQRLGQRLAALGDDEELSVWGRLLEPALAAALPPESAAGENRRHELAVRLERLRFPFAARLLDDVDPP